jgi:hypothetical protein
MIKISCLDGHFGYFSQSMIKKNHVIVIKKDMFVWKMTKTIQAVPPLQYNEASQDLRTSRATPFSFFPKWKGEEQEASKQRC